LKGARFSFAGEPWPRFDVEGIIFEPGTLLEAAENLPLKITTAEIAFLDKDKGLPDKLAPANIQLVGRM
jgi:hypothetical protein